MKIILILIVVGFVVFCGLLVAQSVLFQAVGTPGKPCILLQQTTPAQEPGSAEPFTEQNAQLKAAESVEFDADHAPAKRVILGAAEPKSENSETGFKFQLELSSKGAAIRKVTFSNGPDSRGKAAGFDDRDYRDPQPLVILSPVGNEILSMANKKFVFVDRKLQLKLHELHWKTSDVEKAPDGSQTARFESVIKNKYTQEPVIRLTKTYTVSQGSYMLDFDITVENVSASQQKVGFELAGPLGIGREGFRSDMRKAVAGFRDSNGRITSARLSRKDLRKAKTIEKRRLVKDSDSFLWAAVVNKYFAAVLVPVPDAGKDFCTWVADRAGRFYNPDGDEKADSGDETIGVDLKIASTVLAPEEQTNSKKTYKFQLYIGPKDKSLFDKNQQYQQLGFVQTIDFMACCICPAGVIKPLAFGILSLMKWMYGFFHNYGVVIIILVLLFRFAMHPITRKSQVSMSKMTKLGPKVEELKKKYANNKTELNKQMMALYKEQGASPIMGFLPMMVQMPIWIALWSAVYASIDLRGAPFLPFWITDLSVPDAAYTFPTVLTLPLVGWKIESVNLLPILMGVAFYLQQKLMPSQAAASANPQAAQQQKMMMLMMPFLFPLMLYKAPSGVNLYIMASTFAGVLEQHVIRKHIREREQNEAQGLVTVTSKTGGKVKKKKPKPFYRT